MARRIFISHTTRDDRDHWLALRLADGLRLRGAKVWIAPESIPAGDRWEAAIVGAVLDGCSHFVVILSAASTGAEWVLREIGLAGERVRADPSFRVLPLRVGALADYPGKDLLDSFQAVPYHRDFSTQLDLVATAVGLRPSGTAALPPTAAEPGEFVGREYVFAALERFMEREPQGYFVIEGDPGAGKSAILAELVRRSGCVAHFNVRALGVTTARQFLESVCSQLIARYGLDHPTLPPEATQDGAFLSGLLEEAAGQLDAAEAMIVAVDALDEVELSTQRDGANVLYLPSRLPERVYFVLTRRPVTLRLAIHAPQELYDLGVHREETVRDARAYVIRATDRPGISAWIDQRGMDREVFVSQLVDHSQGNFMYLRHVLPEIERGRYGDLSIELLPRGLQGYYEDHWDRMGMTARPVPVARIRIVYVLSEVRSPVSRGLIARFATDNRLTVDELAVQEVLDDWDQFLHQQETRYSLYHSSFQDFLHRKDIVQAAGVSIEGIHELIADTLWGDLFESG